LTYAKVGKDISCNLGSLNIAKTMDSPDFAQTIEVSIRALTAVSDQTHIWSVPSIEQGNNDSHAIGLGQMNLHGYLAREHVFYGSDEGIDFTNIYFYTVLYHALRASNRIAIERGSSFKGFAQSKYASGEFFDKYTDQIWEPKTDGVDLLHQPLDVVDPPDRVQGRDPQGRQDRPRLLPGALHDQRQPGVLPGRLRDRVREDHRLLCRGHPARGPRAFADVVLQGHGHHSRREQ